MTQKYFDGRLPAEQEALEEQDSGLLDAAAGLRGRFEEQMEKYAFQNALAQVFQVIGRANKYIDENEPWRLAKDEARKPRLARSCTICWRPFASAPDCFAPLCRRRQMRS